VSKTKEVQPENVLAFTIIRVRYKLRTKYFVGGGSREVRYFTTLHGAFKFVEKNIRGGK